MFAASTSLPCFLLWRIQDSRCANYYSFCSFLYGIKLFPQNVVLLVNISSQFDELNFDNSTFLIFRRVQGIRILMFIFPFCKLKSVVHRHEASIIMPENPFSSRFFLGEKEYEMAETLYYVLINPDIFRFHIRHNGINRV